MVNETWQVREGGVSPTQFKQRIKTCGPLADQLTKCARLQLKPM